MSTTRPLVPLASLALALAVSLGVRTQAQQGPPRSPLQTATAAASQGQGSPQTPPASQSLSPTAKPSGNDRPSAHRPVRIFPPEELAQLEGPDRELWQKPDQIMDALAIADGSIVADLGAGGGWFTIRLARRVGPRGTVFAQDIEEQKLEIIERRMQREGLRNVRTVLGEPDNPKLPRQVNAMLIVDTFHEVENPVALLQNARKALTTNGRLGIVDFSKDGGGPGPPMEERVDENIVIANAQAAGLRLLSREAFLPYQYLLVFGRE